MEFRASDPHAQVRAFNVRATLDAFRLLPALGRRLADRHALTPAVLRPGAFLPVQRWLDVLRDIRDAVGPSKVRDVGRNVITSALFPFDDVEAILLSLDDIHQANHRGEVGHYRTRRVSPSVIEIRCETPYPRHFEWGLVEGICLAKAAPGARYAIDYAEGTEPDHTCTLLVTRVDASASTPCS